MEELNLDYLENAIAYSTVFGVDREIFCPSVIEFVTEDTIQNPSNFLALSITKDFYEKHNQVPTVSELKVYLNTDERVKHFKQFAAGYKAFTKADFDRKILLKNTEEFFRQRIISGVLNEAFIKTTADEPVDIAEVYAQVEQAMSIHMADDLGLNLFSDAETYVTELNNEESRISTGFAWLDSQLGGGLLTSGSALYNFCAASNVGKSNFIKSLACNMSKQGKNCLVVSLEMPRYIYANRFVSELSGVAISDLKEESEQIGTFLHGAKDNGYGDILIKDFATGSLTPQALGAFVKRAQKHLGIKFDVVFVDYPELLRSSKSFGHRHDLMVASLYIETRALSFYNEIPFVVVSQLNRDGYNKEKPSMENIGGAIGIVQCSDFCGFLYSTDEMKEINQLALTVGKSRFGPVNKTKRYDINPATLKLAETNLHEETEFLVDTTEAETESAEDYFKNLMAED